MLKAHTCKAHNVLATHNYLSYVHLMASDESDPRRTVRVPLLLTPDEVEALDDWQFANRLRTRSDALREMMRRAFEPGLKVAKQRAAR